MLCFVCVGEPSTRIHLVEEIIRYSAYREHGVYIGANILLTSTADLDPYLHLIHRRTLDHPHVAPLAAWDASKQERGFPYSYVFRSLLPRRVAQKEDRTLAVRLTPGDEATLDNVQLVGTGPNVNFRCEEVFNYSWLSVTLAERSRVILV